MFTVEISINGRIIGILNGRNIEAEQPSPPISRYAYVYRQNDPEANFKGEVTHIRSQGIRKLICKIFEDIQTK